MLIDTPDDHDRVDIASVDILAFIPELLRVVQRQKVLRLAENEVVTAPT